jgi:hypothetical protein
MKGILTMKLDLNRFTFITPTSIISHHDIVSLIGSQMLKSHGGRTKNIERNEPSNYWLHLPTAEKLRVAERTALITVERVPTADVRPFVYSLNMHTESLIQRVDLQQTANISGEHNRIWCGSVTRQEFAAHPMMAHNVRI